MEQTSFTDSSGVQWTVREDGAEDARALAGDALPGTTWLRFESEYEVRRLWHYPDDWPWLNPLQLESLLDRASTVIARFRPAPHRAVGVDDLPQQSNRPADARDSAERSGEFRTPAAGPPDRSRESRGR